jgi:hypothetical protein
MASSRTFRVLWSGIAAVAIVALGGCTTTVVEYSDGRPLPPKPVAGPATPPGAKSTALAVMLGPKPVDTDGNRFPDLIQVETYLFAEPHPQPIYEEGTFVFVLYALRTAADPGSVPIAEWRFSGEQLLKHRAVALAGICHHFNLSLLDHGGDSDIGIGADLTARFEPSDGRPAVKATGVRTIQFGSQISSNSP